MLVSVPQGVPQGTRFEICLEIQNWRYKVWDSRYKIWGMRYKIQVSPWVLSITLSFEFQVSSFTLRYTLIKFAIHRSFFSKNTLVDHTGVCTDTNDSIMLVVFLFHAYLWRYQITQVPTDIFYSICDCNKRCTKWDLCYIDLACYSRNFLHLPNAKWAQVHLNLFLK